MEEIIVADTDILGDCSDRTVGIDQADCSADWNLKIWQV
jgi:hypothetical protein